MYQLIIRNLKSKSSHAQGDVTNPLSPVRAIDFAIHRTHSHTHTDRQSETFHY